MRIVLLVIGLLVASDTVAVGQQPAEWVVYRSSEGGYTVSLPSQPKVETQDVATAEGYGVKQHVAIANDQSPAVFMVAYFDIDSEMTYSIDMARDAMVKTMNGTLINERELSLAGSVGREVKIVGTISMGAPQNKPGNIIETVLLARLYVDRNRIYVLQMLFPKSQDDAAVAAKGRKYFDSFVLLKNEPRSW